MPEKPTLSIVINHYRTPNILKMCLDAIKEKIRTIEHEIIVTDSMTEETTVNMLQHHYPEVRFIGNPHNIGFSKSVNPAFKKARGEFIFSINADIIVKDEKSISDMMAYFDRHPDIGVLGPKLLNIDGSVQQSFFRWYTPLAVLARRTAFGKTAAGKKRLDAFIYKDARRNPHEPFAVDWLMGSAFLMKKDRLEKAGGQFDDRFFMYFEDVDLCRRFKEAGFKAVYFPQAEVMHYHIRASHKKGGFQDVFTNWLTRVHIASYAKFLWKWRVERYFKKI